MVLYRPREPQKYEYYAKDQVEVYWVHFTGNNVTNLLRSYGLTNDKRVFHCGSGSEYQYLFRAMIKELQSVRIAILSTFVILLSWHGKDTDIPNRKKKNPLFMICQSIGTSSIFL